MIKLLNQSEYMKVLKPEKKVEKMNLPESIKKIVKDIKSRAEYEISDAEYYRPIDVSARNEQSNSLKCKAFGLSIEQVPEQKNRHFLTLNVLSQGLSAQSSRTLAAGNKQEILNALKDEGLDKSIESNIYSMCENLRNK